MINVHKKCMGTVNKFCQLSNVEKRGRIKIECEIIEPDVVRFKIYEGRVNNYIALVFRKYFVIFLR